MESPTKLVLNEKDLDSHVLSCPVCYEKFSLNGNQLPRMLTCHHSFCTQCLDRIFRQEGEFLSCPTCREQTQVGCVGAASLRANYTVLNLLGLIEHQEVEVKDLKVESRWDWDLDLYPKQLQVDKILTCSYCDSDPAELASFGCLDCLLPLCNACKLAHVKPKAFKHHNVQDIQDYLKRLPTKCSKHATKDVELCCNQCEIVLCTACLSDHYGHPISSLSEALSRETETIVQLVECLSHCVHIVEIESMRFSDHIELLKTDILGVHKYVDTEVDQIISAINSKRKNVHEALDVKVRGILDVLEEQKASLETKKARLTEGCELGTRISREGSAVELYETFQVLKKILAALDKETCGGRQAVEAENLEAEVENGTLESGADVLLLRTVSSAKPDGAPTCDELFAEASNILGLYVTVGRHATDHMKRLVGDLFPVLESTVPFAEGEWPPGAGSGSVAVRPLTRREGIISDDLDEPHGLALRVAPPGSDAAVLLYVADYEQCCIKVFDAESGLCTGTIGSKETYVEDDDLNGPGSMVLWIKGGPSVAMDPPPGSLDPADTLDPLETVANAIEETAVNLQERGDPVRPPMLGGSVSGSPPPPAQAQQAHRQEQAETPQALLYVLDICHDRIQVFDADTGDSVLMIGAGVEGSGEGELDTPRGITLRPAPKGSPDQISLLYVADGNNNRVQVFDADTGAFLRVIGADSEEGVGPLKFPGGLALRTVPMGAHAKSAGPGSGAGAGAGAADTAAAAAATAAASAASAATAAAAAAATTTATVSLLYVCDSGNHRVKVYDADSGALVRVIGGCVEGSAPGLLNHPYGIAIQEPSSVPGGGRQEKALLYVADKGNDRIQVFDADTGSYVRMFGCSGEGLGQLKGPISVALHAAIDGFTLLFVSEEDNRRVQVFVV